jgi:hypothetical protein
LKSATQQQQNSSTVAGYKKSTPFTIIRKSLMALRFKAKRAGRIFPISMKVPFWGFQLLTKKSGDFFLSQNVWI